MPPTLDFFSDELRLADRRNLALCLIVPAAAVAMTWPFVEVGMHDDASYVHIAKTLAETGQFAYNGWSAMPLGIQVWWAAAWIRLTGFSFTATRLSLLPFALAVTPLVYLFARRSRLSANDSLFAALLTAAQTDYLDHAPLFMTDISSLCLLMASLYGFSRAVESADDGHRNGRVFAWLLLGMLCGVLGGTIRQNVWLALLAGPAVLVVRPGVRTTARVAALICVVIGTACLVLGIRWFNEQPYSIPSATVRLGVDGLREMCGGLPLLLLTALPGCVLPCMTAVAFCVPALDLRTRPRWAFGAGLLLSAVTVLWLQRRAFHRLGAALAEGSLARGVAAGCDIGTGTLDYLRWLALILLVAMASRDIVRNRSRLLSAARRLPPTLLVPIAYICVYMAALTQFKSSSGHVWTRYFLVVTPFLACGILYWATYRRGRDCPAGESRSPAGWLLVALTAAYGVAVVHDGFAEHRARADAIRFLELQGVPRSRISSGWEVDHWEQVERIGHLNNPRIRKPADAWQPTFHDGYPMVEGRELNSFLTPEYIIDRDPAQYPGDGTHFPVFSFRGWMPASPGRITIQHHTPSQSTSTGGKAGTPGGP